MTDTEQWIVVAGEPGDGFGYTGPFDDPEVAAKWATDTIDGEVCWWVVSMNPAPLADYHVNVYERGREYGGPEEGGWWFDTGRYMPQMSRVLDGATHNLAMATLFADDLADRLGREANENGVPQVGYSNYRGGRYLVLVENEVGRDLPHERPVYS